MEIVKSKNFFYGIAAASFCFIVCKLFPKLKLKSTNPDNEKKKNQIILKNNNSFQNKSVNSENSFESVEFSKVELIFEHIFEQTVEEIVIYYKNFGSGTNDKNTMLEKLETIPHTLIKSNNIDLGNFFSSYYQFCKADKNFKCRSDFLVNLKTKFMNNNNNTLELPTQYPKELSINYLKIVTNIFYINLFYTCLEYKIKYIDNPTEVLPNFENVKIIYSKNLPFTRQEIYSFYNIPKLIEIRTEFLVQLYVYSLPENTEIRKRFDHHSETIDKVIQNLLLNKLPNVFKEIINGDIHNASSKIFPVNKEIDLEILLE